MTIGRAGQAARLGDERRVGALAGAGRAAQQNDLLRETQVLAAEVGFEILPDRFEDQLAILDLEIVELAPERVCTLWIHEVRQCASDKQSNCISKYCKMYPSSLFFACDGVCQFPRTLALPYDLPRGHARPVSSRTSKE